MIWNIITDSSCDLQTLSFNDENNELRYDSVPFVLNIGGEDFVDDDTLDEAAIKQVAAWTDIEKISVSDTHAVGLKKDGTLVNLTFKVRDGASGDCEIKLICDKNSVCNYDEQLIPINAQSGKITVK